MHVKVEYRCEQWFSACDLGASTSSISITWETWGHLHRPIELETLGPEIWVLTSSPGDPGTPLSLRTTVLKRLPLKRELEQLASNFQSCSKVSSYWSRM